MTPTDTEGLLREAAQRLVDVIFAEAQAEPFVLPLRGMRAANDLRAALVAAYAKDADPPPPDTDPSGHSPWRDMTPEQWDRARTDPSGLGDVEWQTLANDLLDGEDAGLTEGDLAMFLIERGWTRAAIHDSRAPLDVEAAWDALANESVVTMRVGGDISLRQTIARHRHAIEAAARLPLQQAIERLMDEGDLLRCRCGHRHSSGSDGEDAGCPCGDGHDWAAIHDSRAPLDVERLDRPGNRADGAKDTGS